jgi:hypothetical protein
MLESSSRKHVLFNKRAKNSFHESNKEYKPIIREADPGGLGACPQEKTCTNCIKRTRTMLYKFSEC